VVLSDEEEVMYTTSTAFLEALTEAGVTFAFANFGSDYPPILEAYAEAETSGRIFPTVINCPHEMVALSAAHGYAQVTGKPQAVFVHVDVGTQNLGGAVHNVAKSRVPVLIFAGASPFTQQGELRGTRNEHIQWYQDVFHQRDIVRDYVRYDAELRTGKNVKQIVFRALQIATSEPKGPVYLVGPREVLEEDTTPVTLDRAVWQPIGPSALTADRVAEIALALRSAKRPLVITSYLGRNPAAVAPLVALCDSLGIGVLESVPGYVNFPRSHPLHQGEQWNAQVSNPIVADADVILVVDSDVPWIPAVNPPRPDAQIFHIDTDPLKEDMPLWYIGALRSLRADAQTALEQINAHLAISAAADQALVTQRREHYTGCHARYFQAVDARAEVGDDVITPDYLASRIRLLIDDTTIVLNEGISSFGTIGDHLRIERPGSMFTGNGGSLGWNGGAAIGMKLAAPEATVIALTGDGSYLFSVPSSVHWVARRYATPFLQIIFNNGGWRSPKLSMLSVHPDGFGSKSKDLPVSFDHAPDYAAIATAAGGAFGRSVARVSELDAVLAEALRVVREEQRCAVIDVHLPHF
jgi:acetolactate synthase-1/2/3 large subunit